ncbi:SsrA-binding protein SmpB [Roseospirillum parvum]|uniref:SsrA-binding protein n=1 Tax=Roseospirillum parvum TaxID=83401 RepID=A0A1G7YFA3_9PROT|nr:SsrA-binding protein SmpB [Roseospirillum parvum]SDG95006.1 SsrA-binding protein [Roseospirillum parvum]
MAGKQAKSGLIATGRVAENRRARHDYQIGDTFEAGIQLTGTEVKSLRHGRANIQESYASVEGGEVWLINAHIPEYPNAALFNHEPKRRRKLLLKRREIARLFQAVGRQGMTLVPLHLYFNDRGIAKLNIGLAKGKRQVDKRQTEKARDWERQKGRLLREKG